MAKIKHFRWWIAGLVTVATAINYLDRQSLPVVINELQDDISISDAEYSQLQAYFLFAYAIMYTVGGKIIDTLGTRFGYALMVIWWSAATFLHGIINSVAGLGIARFLLGIGEGGGFPGSAKAVAEWFPPKERSFAFGLFNTGSSLGAVIAPPIIAVIVLELDWRWVFFITASLGFIWVIFWLRLYRSPDKSKHVTDDECAYIKTSQAEQSKLAEDDAEVTIRWRDLFRYRQIWGMLLARFVSEGAWFFFIFWLPKYLGDIRGLDIKEIGYFAWIPYAFAGAGSFVGGWFSSYLIKRNVSLDASRKIALGIAAFMMPVALFIANAPLSLAIVFFGIAMFGHQFWSTIMQTLGADIFPSKVVGSVIGILGSVGTFGAMLFNLFVGFLLTHFSYAIVFIFAGVMHPIAFILILLVVGKIEPVEKASMPRWFLSAK